MNTSIISFILGQVMKFEAILMILPCLISIMYRETDGLWYLLVLTICGLLGVAVTIKKPSNNVFYLKEGCVATALSWIVISIFGCIPFVLTGDIPSFTDALFETISGFSTTGASIVPFVEDLSKTNIFWRSFTHWIGGMGVLVFILAIIPLSGGSNINLMRAESPGPSVGKFAPKLRYTARILYLIYLVLTLIEIIFLLAGNMPLFDAVTTSFGTAGTGGFGIKNDSLMSYSPYIQWVVTIFMIVFGVNFNFYYFLLLRQFKRAFNFEEVRCYFLIISASIGIIFADIHIFHKITDSAFSALTHSSFQVASIISSTGFATTDFNTWPQTSKYILILLMFVGACAGSTGGGIKVSRITLLFKSLRRELHSYIHPKSVKMIKVDGKTVENDIVHSISVYLITFLIILSASIFVLSFENKDFVTNSTAVLTTLNNIGPGLREVGPTGNFSKFTPLSKYVLMFDMLAGRLELFPILLLFNPAIWKNTITSQKSFSKKS